MTDYIIRLKEYGYESIGARVIGINIRNEVLEKLIANPDAIIIIDFEGIKYISTGFSKELFGELFKELGNDFFKKIRIRINKNNSIIKEIILKGIRSNIIE